MVDDDDDFDPDYIAEFCCAAKPAHPVTRITHVCTLEVFHDGPHIYSDEIAR